MWPSVCIISHAYILYIIYRNNHQCVAYHQCSTPSVCSTSSVPASCGRNSLVLSVSGEDDVIKIPDLWRPEVREAIKDHFLSVSARNNIVRTLASHLFSKVNKPTRSHCDDRARKIILKYPFFRDDLGNGYVSTVCFI